jgi:hypothetical protein
MAKKYNTEKEESTSNIETTPKEEISVSKKADVVPAKEEKPDQSILNKPAPKRGISLKESWGHKKHLKNN